MHAKERNVIALNLLAVAPVELTDSEEFRDAASVSFADIELLGTKT
jgi:hypothetical protein